MPFQSLRLSQDEQLVEEHNLATEPDWITQMLEQVQKVGLWNEPIPEEPGRTSDLPETTHDFATSQMMPIAKNESRSSMILSIQSYWQNSMQTNLDPCDLKAMPCHKDV